MRDSEAEEKEGVKRRTKKKVRNEGMIEGYKKTKKRLIRKKL